MQGRGSGREDYNKRLDKPEYRVKLSYIILDCSFSKRTTLGCEIISNSWPYLVLWDTTGIVLIGAADLILGRFHVMDV